MAKVNIKTVAEKAGVAHSTVSRVINKSGYVSETTRQKVMDVIENLGFQQNKLASSLRKKTTDFVGLIVPDISNDYFASLAKSIELFLQTKNYGVFLCNSEDLAKKEAFYIKSLLANQVEGIILAQGSHRDKKMILPRNIPIVFSEPTIDSLQHPNVRSVSSDHFRGGYIAGYELIARGARNLLFLNSEREMQGTSIRKKGFETAVDELSQSEKNVTYQLVGIPVSASAAESVLHQLLDRERYDGIFCWNDIMAFGVLKCLRERHLRVPDDIQVIGFDGIEFGNYVVPSLTSIKQDTALLGTTIGETMYRMIRQEACESAMTIPVELIERGSLRKVEAKSQT